MAKTKLPPAIAKRTKWLERMDAVHKLQQIGEHRRASMLNQGLTNEVQRLSGLLHHTTNGELRPTILQSIKEIQTKLKSK